MKKFIFVLILAMMTISLVSFAQNSEISVYLDTEKIEFDVEPQIIKGRTMVPIRAIFEKIGATVEWDETTKTATSSKEKTVVKMTVDSTVMYINNDIVSMDVSPVVIEGRTLAPARYVAEAFGANVAWDAKNNNVIISFENIPVIPEYKTGITLYADDGRTISVSEEEVDAYLNVGWHKTVEETKQMLYAEDGRTISVFKAEVPAYLNVGWYETSYDAQQAKQSKNATIVSRNRYNPGSDGYYYRTPTGKKYHLDPNCGGKNSYRTSSVSGLSPCEKCAY